jgi:diaminopimelate epimerase
MRCILSILVSGQSQAFSVHNAKTERIRMKFTKMQAMGNCYIYVEQFTQTTADPSRWAKILSNRETGVGSDGLILLCPSEVADVRMRVFNPDGTEAEMCGNALRSVGLLAFTDGFADKPDMTVETLGGIKRVWVRENNITASIGPPDVRFVEKPLDLRGRIFPVTAMSWGNPHAVCWLPSTEDIYAFPLHEYGPELERHTLFPNRTNTEFAQIIDQKTLMMRAWERGTGETWACATGCCTALVSGVLTGRCEDSVEVKQLGGSIFVKWDRMTNDVTMTGPSKIVFRGEVSNDYNPEFSA